MTFIQKRHFHTSYSPRRQEIYVHSSEQDRIAFTHEVAEDEVEEIAKVNSEDKLDEFIIENYESELRDMGLLELIPHIEVFILEPDIDLKLIGGWLGVNDFCRRRSELVTHTPGGMVTADEYWMLDAPYQDGTIALRKEWFSGAYIEDVKSSIECFIDHMNEVGIAPLESEYNVCEWKISTTTYNSQTMILKVHVVSKIDIPVRKLREEDLTALMKEARQGNIGVEDALFQLNTHKEAEIQQLRDLVEVLTSGISSANKELDGYFNDTVEEANPMLKELGFQELVVVEVDEDEIFYVEQLD